MSQWQDNTRQNKTYKLEPYDPQWAKDFEELKLSLVPLFGNNLVDFHHIGSTSIPGMLAKAQIDVCAVVKSLQDVKLNRMKFEELGFEAKGDYVGQSEEYFTYTNNQGQRKYNVHTLQQGNPAIEGYLSFRDYLRQFSAKKEEYISIKEGLRRQYGENDYNSYDWKKGDLIKRLKSEALQWYRENLDK